jgi:hypothetical protein
VLVGHSIIPDLVNAIIGWFASLWTKTKQIFNTLRQGIVDQIWNACGGRRDGPVEQLLDAASRPAVTGAWT